MTKKIRPGDYRKLDSGDEGYVVDITWRNTTIRALANNIIVVPNKKLAESIIVNFNLKRLHARFKKEGIEIPFPATKVYFQKE